MNMCREHVHLVKKLSKMYYKNLRVYGYANNSTETNIKLYLKCLLSLKFSTQKYSSFKYIL